jgi:starch synthase
MKLLVAAAEVAPLVRTGGLGDAVAGLSRALARRGHDVTVAIPRYRDVRTTVPDRSWGSAGHRDFRVIVRRDDGAFDRPGVYGPTPGSGYDDNWWRFGCFAAAVGAIAEEFDMVHLHDGHVGGAAPLISGPTVATIHNASHHLLGPLQPALDLLGLDEVAAADLEWYGQANYLKALMVGASRVTTVSPTHAAELTQEETSFGLAGVVASLSHPIVGILNGIDVDSWDPAIDATLPAPFSARDPASRAKSRQALLDLTGIDDGVIFGNVGRMARQKGLDLLEPILARLVEEGVRLVLVGSGELDVLVDDWVDRYEGKVTHLAYDERLARLVCAGADAYLMPSEFEPCGLGQLYSMHYGAPPVVHLTGGLADSVVDADDDPEAGTGFGFHGYGSANLEAAVLRAAAVFRDEPDRWSAIQRNGMSRDWSWAARAGEYESVYAAAQSP